MSLQFSEGLSSVRFSTTGRHSTSERFQLGENSLPDTSAERRRSSLFSGAGPYATRDRDGLSPGPSRSSSKSKAERRPSVLEEIRMHIAETASAKSTTASPRSGSAQGLTNGHSNPSAFEQLSRKTEIQRIESDIKSPFPRQLEKAVDTQLQRLFEERVSTGGVSPGGVSVGDDMSATIGSATCDEEWVDDTALLSTTPAAFRPSSAVVAISGIGSIRTSQIIADALEPPSRESPRRHNEHEAEQSSWMPDSIKKRTSVSEIMLEQSAKFDKEASFLDETEAHLFHTQWSLIREQFSFFASELEKMRTDLKGLKDWEAKSQLKLLQQSDVLAELSEEPRFRQENNDKLAAEMKEHYSSLTEAINREMRDRTAELNDAMSFASHNKLLIEQESRDRAAAFNELARRMQTAVDSLERERLDRDHSNAGLRSHISSLLQELAAEKTTRSDEYASMKRAIQSVEAAAMQHIKDLQNTIEGRNVKAMENLQHLIDVEGLKRKQLSEDVVKNLSNLKTYLDRDSKSFSTQIVQITNIRAEFDREREQREQYDALTRKSIAENRQQIEVEKGERLNSEDALRRELQAMLGKINSQHNDELLKVGRDMSAFDLAMNQQENHLRALRNDLEEEGKLRIAGDELVQDMLRAEKSDRIAGDAENLHGLVKLDTGVAAFRDLMQGQFAMLSDRLDKPRTEPARVTTFYIGED